MTTDTINLARDQSAAPGRAAPAARSDDKAMLKAAADLTRDLNRASPASSAIQIEPVPIVSANAP